jgi:hypothetical protein
MDGEMAENDTVQKLAFLYKIIDDNQATIRFLDTKAAFGIALLGAIIGKVLDREQLIAFVTHGILILLIFIAFAVLVIISAVIGFRTVFPTVDPKDNVTFPDNLEPKFFIANFKPKGFLRYFSSNKKFAMLATTHAAYCSALEKANAENLMKIAAAEVLKLSFIRQLKTDRLTAFSKVLIFTVIGFIFLTLTVPKPSSQWTTGGSDNQGMQGTYYTITEQGSTPKDNQPGKSKSLSKGSPKNSPK